MNYSIDSDNDNSFDSPIHSVCIRLSDIGKIEKKDNDKFSRTEGDSFNMRSKDQLQRALHQIDGAPETLQQAIHSENRKMLFGKYTVNNLQTLINTESAIPTSKLKRAPPRPPVSEYSAGSGKRPHLQHQAPSHPPHPVNINASRKALQFQTVDYSTITSPDHIGTTR
jgi:hypothetical protein